MARPRGSKNKRTVFLNNLLDDHKFDWRKDLADAIKTKNVALIAFYVPLLPYLLARMVPKEHSVSQSPTESVANAKKLMDELNNFNDPKPKTDSNQSKLDPGSTSI